jgi:hypothetical protein
MESAIGIMIFRLLRIPGVDGNGGSTDAVTEAMVCPRWFSPTEMWSGGWMAENMSFPLVKTMEWWD